MSTYKVSVIVPVYNCEDDLRRSLDSLVGQTFSALEIVLVNDGSTDNSAAICQEYQQKQSNVRYVYQENGGVSAARNTGLRIAQGDYVMFLDADDYYEPKTAEQLYEKAYSTKADMVLGGVHKRIGGADQFVSCGDFDATERETATVIVQMARNFTLNQVWGKLYRRALILENQLFFNEQLSSGEDLDWMCRLLIHVQAIAGLSTPLYHYIVDNTQSLSQKFLPNYFDQIYRSFSSLKNLYAAKNLLETEQETLRAYHAHRIWRGFAQINKINCPFRFKGKFLYVRNGLLSPCFKEYRSWEKRYLSFVKDSILRLRPAALMTVVLLILGKVHHK